jgi:hypothetical protein
MPSGREGGNMKTEKLNLSDFTQLNIRGAFRFEIVRSDAYAVSITREWFKRTRAFKDGGVLVIDHPWYDVLGWFTPWIIPKAKIEMPKLGELKVSGASKGSITGFDSLDDFKLKVRGASRLSGDISSGNAEIDLAGASRIELASSVKALRLKVVGASDFEGKMKADSGEIEVQGASRIRISGSMEDVAIKVAGASHLEMGDLIAHNAKIKLTGASRCSLNIEGKLDAELAGASRLIYGGNPVMGNISTTGASVLTKK